MIWHTFEKFIRFGLADAIFRDSAKRKINIQGVLRQQFAWSERIFVSNILMAFKKIPNIWIVNDMKKW